MLFSKASKDDETYLGDEAGEEIAAPGFFCSRRWLVVLFFVEGFRGRLRGDGLLHFLRCDSLMVVDDGLDEEGDAPHGFGVGLEHESFFVVGERRREVVPRSRGGRPGTGSPRGGRREEAG